MASIIHVLLLIGSVSIFWQKTHSKAISLKSSREFLGLLLPLKLGTIRFFYQIIGKQQVCIIALKRWAKLFARFGQPKIKCSFCIR